MSEVETIIAQLMAEQRAVAQQGSDFVMSEVPSGDDVSAADAPAEQEQANESQAEFTDLPVDEVGPPEPELSPWGEPGAGPEGEPQQQPESEQQIAASENQQEIPGGKDQPSLSGIEAEGGTPENPDFGDGEPDWSSWPESPEEQEAILRELDTNFGQMPDEPEPAFLDFSNEAQAYDFGEPDSGAEFELEDLRQDASAALRQGLGDLRMQMDRRFA